MSEQQEQRQNALRAAARMAYGADSGVKYRLAQYLINRISTPDPAVVGSVSLDSAAGVCGLPAQSLIALLQNDSCFRLSRGVVIGPGGGSGYSVALNADILLNKGRKSTKAGILAEELPPPTGYVGGLHPIRPGRPDCKHWVQFGNCAFNKICVFNHPGVPSAGPIDNAQQQQQSHQVSSRAHSASSSRASSPSPYADSSSTTAAAGGGGGAAGFGGRRAASPSLLAPAGPSRPGARPCVVFLTRGLCPAGPTCPFDHPVTEGGAVSPTSPEPSSYQQQQQQQQQQQPSKQLLHEFPPLGLNEQGFPMYQGAPNCPFYMGTGRCDFGDRCKFHHPRYALHPECVNQGLMPRKYERYTAAPYARIINQLQRVWDYNSCVEAQLKIWLAHHLLAKANPACGMFSSAASYAAAEESAVGGEAYSCTLKEADQVLQLLWKAQPDEAANSPMPFTQKLRDLLAGDPYWEIAAAAAGSSIGAAGMPCVKLRVQKIKELLNF